MPDDGRPGLPDIDCIRGFAGSSPMAVAVLEGPAHRIRYANPACLAATGRAEAALLDRRLAEAFPALGAASLAALDRVHGTGEACRGEAVALPLGPATTDDAPHLWDVELSAVRGGGAIAGVLVLLRDVTPRRPRRPATVPWSRPARWRSGPPGRMARSGRMPAGTR
ncbi:PAS domain-containing protein [Dankookia sp. P2]|uniref:PAS domain-containing protein n=1 Tax=Dankookia sp. P2 TaxID=3423955 RepID=UPI003D667A56